MQKLRVLIADDHSIVREGARQLLDAQPDMDVVGQSNCGEEALQHAREHRPDVIVLDISMPDFNGLDLLSLLKRASPLSKVVILSVHQEPMLVRQALASGARGYVVKTAPVSGLIALPDSKTGQKAVFLNEAAVELLRSLPRVPGNPYVLVGAREGGHIINLQKPWRRIRKLADIEDVRIHDLRHSFASIAAAQGASLQLIGRLLGHTNAQTTQRYAHLVADQVKELNETVGQKVGSALGRHA
ncbi:MAG: response regulator [Alphaproteobacteria bacterium]|nr:response regulator [Alphaproteobacteria bacterium]